MLDVFSYLGGWGVQAACGGRRAGALRRLLRPAALELLERNARLNGVESRVAARQGDAFDVLRDPRTPRASASTSSSSTRPPSSSAARTRRRARRPTGASTASPWSCSASDGILVSASCSFHLSRDALLGVMLRAARELGRDFQVVEEGHQAADHPVHPAIPETSYLKAFFARMLG